MEQIILFVEQTFWRLYFWTLMASIKTSARGFQWIYCNMIGCIIWFLILPISIWAILITTDNAITTTMCLIFVATLRITRLTDHKRSDLHFLSKCHISSFSFSALHFERKTISVYFPRRKTAWHKFCRSITYITPFLVSSRITSQNLSITGYILYVIILYTYT